MMSPISEVKPSQVAQLTTENDKLKAVIDKLTNRIDIIINDITNIVKGSIQEEMIPEITQSVQEVVEEVKEENAKLKEKNAILKEENRRLEAENDKLKEKNDELKQFAMKVHNFVYNTNYDDEDIVSAFDFDGILEEMKKDEDELTEKCGEWKDKFMILEESAKKHLGNGFNDYKQ